MISLLCIAGKILARIILNRLITYIADFIVPESQCGFLAGRGTSDMVFAVRQLQEKCREQNQELHLVFVDLTKAFDTVNWNGLWKILQKSGCPDKLTALIASFHDGMQACTSSFALMGNSSTCEDSKPRPKCSRPSYGSSSSQTTVHWVHTLMKTCSTSRMLRSGL